MAMTKFIQITSSTPSAVSNSWINVFALDEDGRVW
jgi:hypothetical protein